MAQKGRRKASQEEVEVFARPGDLDDAGAQDGAEVAAGQGEAASRAASESSLSRLLGTLGLFSTDSPSLTVDEIATRLKVPKSTAYRYIQELSKVGLLVRLDRSITLGPRIIELDRCIRESDPVIRAAAPPMRELGEQTGLDVFLSKLYGHSIITVHTEFNDPLPHLRYGLCRCRAAPARRRWSLSCRRRGCAGFTRS